MGTPQGTQDRQRVVQIAPSRPEDALRIARAITDPWFRCQSLAIAAQFLSDKARKSRTLATAFDSAMECIEPNRVVTVSSWPLKVLCAFGTESDIKKHAARLVDIANSEPSPVRRADALNYLAGAVLKGPGPVFWQVFEQFERACLTTLQNGKRNSKGEKLLSFWAPWVFSHDSARAEAMISAIHSQTHRDRAVAAIAEFLGAEAETWYSWPNLS